MTKPLSLLLRSFQRIWICDDDRAVADVADGAAGAVPVGWVGGVLLSTTVKCTVVIAPADPVAKSPVKPMAVSVCAPTAGVQAFISFFVSPANAYGNDVSTRQLALPS